MEVRNLRPLSGAGTLVACFDLVVNPEITMNDWQLRKTEAGLKAFPPSPRKGRPCATLSPSAFAEIGRLAVHVYKGGKAQNDATRDN